MIYLSQLIKGDFTEKAKAVRAACENRNHEYGGDVWIDTWTGFDFSARQDNYSSLTFKTVREKIK